MKTGAGQWEGLEPRELGRYSLVAKLASGGMGEVYLARLRSMEGVEKSVAIKLLLPQLARDEEIVAMFVNEARIASRLSHPNICQVFELGMDADELYISMEFLEGIPLTTILKSRTPANPLDPSIACALVAQACTGLHYAHEMRDDDGNPMEIVHRDISPANLFLTNAGVVKVLDFGVVKANDTVQKTRTGALKGKYAYMSPEQLFAQPIDRRADVFAMGIVLFELLTNRQLFARASEYETLKAITEEPIRQISAVRKDLPRELCAVVDKALARNRDERYASCAELGDAITSSMWMLGGCTDAAGLGEMVRLEFAAHLKRGVDLLRQSRERQVSARIDRDAATVVTPAGSRSRDGIVASTARVPAIPTPEATTPPQPARTTRSRALPLAIVTLSLALVSVAAALYFGRKPEPPKASIVFQGQLEPDSVDRAASRADRPGVVPAASADADASGSSTNVGSIDAGDVGSIDAGEVARGDQPKTSRKGCARHAEIAKRNSCLVNEKAGAFKGCLDHHAVEVSGSPELTLTFELADSGAIAAATLHPSGVAETPLGRCLLGVARRIEFGKQGKALRFKIPLKIRAL